MLFLEYLRMAFESLRSSKLRSALTLLGIVIGVFSVIAAVTAVQVIEVYFNDTFRGMGANTFYVTKVDRNGIQIGPEDPSLRNRPNLTYADMETLRRRADLPVSIAPDAWFGRHAVKFSGEETEPNVSLRGVNQDWAVNNGFEIEQGRFLTEDDVRYARPVVVLGAPIVKQLFDVEQPLGKNVRIDGRRFQVVGTFVEKGALLGDSPDNIAMAPVTRTFDIYGRLDRNISYDIRAPSAPMLQATIDQVTGHLRIIRGVPPQDDDNFDVVTNDLMRGPVDSFTATLTVGGAAIGLIALLAAGIGIMNIMLVSVTERTREIGIRKALGATRRDVLSQFLLEAVFLCQIGGLIGIGLGVLGGNALAFAFDLRATFPWAWALIGVVGVTVIALVFGVYPAYKAARLSPIEALRYE
ncbi:MAG: ABC transporter permease [Bacteroidota bacterium]